MDFLELDIYSFMNCLLLWVGLILGFTIVELLTYKFFALCFSCGSASALVVSLFDASMPVQIAIFLLMSGLMIFFIRPLAYKVFRGECEYKNSDIFIRYDSQADDKEE